MSEKIKLQPVDREINKSSYTLSDHIVEVNDMVQTKGQQERFYNEIDHLVEVTEVVIENKTMTNYHSLKTKVDNE